MGYVQPIGHGPKNHAVIIAPRLNNGGKCPARCAGLPYRGIGVITAKCFFADRSTSGLIFPRTYSTTQSARNTFLRIDVRISEPLLILDHGYGVPSTNLCTGFTAKTFTFFSRFQKSQSNGLPSRAACQQSQFTSQKAQGIVPLSLKSPLNLRIECSNSSLSASQVGKP